MAALQHTASSLGVYSQDTLQQPADMNQEAGQKEAGDDIVLEPQPEEDFQLDGEDRQETDGDNKTDEEKEREAKDRKRVKVYELRDTSWFDRGTGYCRGVVLDDGVAVIMVDSEEPITEEAPDEPGGFITHDNLLNAPVEKEDIYGKQQDTLIVWTDPRSGLDIALSFQDSEGCEDTWNFICDIQKHLLSMATDEEPPNLPSSSSPIHAETEYALPTHPEKIKWLPPSLANIRDQEYCLRLAAKTAQGRDRCIEHILNEDYIKRLTVILEQAEDLESIDDLHALCSLMQTILLFNENGVFEYILQEDVFLGVIGILEYDPEHPEYKANYRTHFRESAVYRSVIPIPDRSILRKIHQTYRLLFLKDVVLARMIDDPAFNILNGFVFFNQVDILNYLQGTEGILEGLFAPFRETIPLPAEEGEAAPPLDEKKRDIVFFLHSLCTTAKTIQLAPRINLYRNLVDRGIVGPIKYALRRPEARIRHAGAEMLTLVVEHDSNTVRLQVFKEEERKERTLVQEVVEVLQSPTNGGLTGQMGDTLKTLLEGPPDTESFLGKKEGPMADTFNTYFYENVASTLFKPLLDIPDFKSDPTAAVGLPREYTSRLQTLVELLSYCVIHHAHRSSYFILSNPISKKVVGLLYVRNKPLRHAALRFLKACLRTPNHFIHRYFVKQDLLEPLITLMEDESTRDNMMCSACMEVIEQVRKDNLKSIINYLFDSYTPRLEMLSRRPLLKTIIMSIRSRWEMNNEPAPSVPLIANTSMTETEGWGERREEEWFEESDEETVGDLDESGEAVDGDEREGVLSKRKRAGQAGGPKKRTVARSTSAGVLGLDYDDPQSPSSPQSSPLQDPSPNSTPALTTTTSLLDRTVMRAEKMDDLVQEKQQTKSKAKARRNSKTSTPKKDTASSKEQVVGLGIGFETGGEGAVGLEEGLGDVQAKMREKRRREEEEEEGFAGLFAGTKPMPVATVAASAAAGGGAIDAGKGEEGRDDENRGVVGLEADADIVTGSTPEIKTESKKGGMKEAGKKIRLNLLGKRFSGK